MAYYYINPNYSIERHDQRVLIYEDFKDKFAKVPYTPRFESAIHPVHAQILTFFHGISDIEEGAVRASVYFNVSKEKIISFVKPLIENRKRQVITYKNKLISFPEFTLIKTSQKIKNILKYNPDSFNVKNVDISRKRFSLPRQIMFMPTFKCHTNCIYCFEDRRNPNAHKILPIEKVKELINEAKNLNVKEFEVMGGEIFLYPSWYEMFKHLKLHGYDSLISTKFPLTEDMVYKLQLLGIERIQISLDSLISDHLMSILRVKENYVEKIKESIDLLGKYNINIDIHTILTNKNSTLDDMNSIYNFIKNKSNVREWRIDVVYASYFSEFSQSALIPKEHEIKKIEEVFSAIEHKNYRFVFSGYEIKPEYISPEKQREGFLFMNAVKCPANYNQMTILPDGQVTICGKLFWSPEFIIGDIKAQSIEEVWKSQRAIDVYQIRKKIRNISNCTECNDFDICEESNNVCLMNVFAAYGPENWDYPDPNCHRAPLPLIQGYI